MTLTIEQARPEDALLISELIEEIEIYYGASDISPEEERVRQVKALLFGESPVARVLLARDEDQVAGMASYSFLWPAAGASHSLFLKELFVREPARRRGVARLLMERVQQIATKSGCSRVEWQTERDNIDARRFYEAIGASVHDGKIFYRVDA
ncbi:GNAT family N-acetyltransferase [Streptosporangium sp. NPDC049046]|uniref:GNAT family N-acetyltransferase n=1 Tax=Streptosporangium sp. NPDC049046 TaxID=3155031 RepID=UPI003449E929